MFHLGLLDYAGKACQCSTLFYLFVNDEEKKFFNIGTWCQSYKTFFSSRLMKRANKLDWLPLTSLSSLFGVMQEVFYKGEHLISAYVGPIRPGLPII
jgi:hypothetical protein